VQFARKPAAGFETPVGLPAIVPGIDALNSSSMVATADDIWHNGGVPRLITSANSVDVDDNLFCLVTVSPTATTGAGILVSVNVMLVPSLVAPARKLTAGNIYSAAGYES